MTNLDDKEKFNEHYRNSNKAKKLSRELSKLAKLSYILYIKSNKLS
jgi:hypothetical protein